MYFWRIEKLKAELREGALPQRQQFYYYLAQSLVLAIVTIPLPDANRFDVISGIVSLFVTIVGIVYLYRCNDGDRGSRFLERTFSIGFVVGVRLLVLLGLPLIVLYLLAVTWFLEFPAETTLTDVVLFALVEILVIWRISVHLRQVAATKAV